MNGHDQWKYCTQEQIHDVLRSFRLLDGVHIEEEKYFSCLYSVSNHPEQHYHPAVIPKKNGGTRKLMVPDYLLCRIQKNILHHVLAEIPVSSYATAYKPKSSVLENARPHVGAQEVLKLDIQNFFDSITFFQVYRSAFPAVYYPPAIRAILANLCCYRDSLPQGAPTSPGISNLVMKPFDEYMGNWCKERGICYTRYCDDMTFSGTFDRQEAKKKVRGFLAAYGFELNEKKTRVQKKHRRQTVTGIVVNEKPQASRAYRRKLRAEIYYCKKYGAEYHLQAVTKCKGVEDVCEREVCREKARQIEGGDCIHYLQSLLGKVNYVLQVNPDDAEFYQAKKQIKELLRKEVNHESKKAIKNADGLETI